MMDGCTEQADASPHRPFKEVDSIYTFNIVPAVNQPLGVKSYTVCGIGHCTWQRFKKRKNRKQFNQPGLGCAGLPAVIADHAQM